MSKRKIKKELRKKIISIFGSKCYLCNCELAAVFRIKNVISVSKGLVKFETDGKMEVLPLMTLDHLVPRSKGGKNTIENLRPCCNKCNVEKGNKCTILK